MKKTTILMTLTACILSICTFTGCGPKESSDTNGASSAESVSVTEKTENKETSQDEQVSSDDEIVEEVREFAVDENADGEENGYSQEIVIP